MRRIVFILSPIAKSILKALIWGGFNIIAGLAPFLIVIFAAATILDHASAEASKEEITHLTNECVILFFCCAMIGEITIETLISQVKFSKYSYFGFCSSCFMVLGSVCILYTIIVFGKFEIPSSHPNILIEPHGLLSNADSLAQKLVTHMQAFNASNNMSAFQNMVIGFTLLYCLFIKSLLIFEEDRIYAYAGNIEYNTK